MHLQIRYIIDNIRSEKGRVVVDFDADQNSPMGKLMYLIYTQLLDKRGKHTFSTQPEYNTFCITGVHLEVAEKIETLKEGLAQFSLSTEENEVRRQLSFITQEILSIYSRRIPQNV